VPPAKPSGALAADRWHLTIWSARKNEELLHYPKDESCSVNRSKLMAEMLEMSMDRVDGNSESGPNGIFSAIIEDAAHNLEFSGR
jgi:hypothetical protein